MNHILLLCLCLHSVIASTFIAGNSYAQLNQLRQSGFNADGLSAVSTLANGIGGVVRRTLDGDIYFGDFGNCRVRKIVTFTNTVATVAGTGVCGHTGNGDLAINAQVSHPTSVAIDPLDINLVFGEFGSDTVRKVDLDTGIITVIAGSAANRCGTPNDGGLATDASLCLPSIAYDASGDMFIAEAIPCRIRKVARITNIITTIAGTGSRGFSPDGNNALSMTFNHISSIGVDLLSGKLFFADQDNHRVRTLTDSTVATVAGTGTNALSGNNVNATVSAISQPGVIAVDLLKAFYFMEPAASGVRVRKVAPNFNMNTIIGGGASISNNISATSMKLNTSLNIIRLGGISFHGGDIYVADANSIHLIPEFNSSGSQCGNGIVETGEQCDSPSPCCSPLCQFQPSNVTCRAAAGPCDLPEKCPGNSIVCPNDILDSNSACIQSIGLCPLIGTNSFSRCTGGFRETFCGTPGPSLDLTPVGSVTVFGTTFSVVAFAGDIRGPLLGKIGGRIAAKNNIDLGDLFTVAENLNPYFDSTEPFALIAGRDLIWNSGTLYPNFRLIDPLANPENALVGGAATVGGFLTSQLKASSCGSVGCLDTAFTKFRSDVATLQFQATTLAENVKSSVAYSGLMLQCSSNTDTRYVFNIKAAALEGITWISTRGCNGFASWWINVLSEFEVPVTLSGDSFPTISEKTVISVLGIRTINVKSTVNANIYAEFGTLSQTGGTINGQVFVANVSTISSVAVTRCDSLKTVVVTDYLRDAVSANSNTLTVVSGGNIFPGDSVTIGSTTLTVKTRKNNAKDGSATLTLSGNVGTNLAASTVLRFQYHPSGTARFDDSLPIVVANVGTSTVASLYLVMLAVVALL